MRPSRAVLARHLILVGTALGLAAPSSVTAQPQTAASGTAARMFDIPAQPLRTALRQLMQQGGLQIGFEADEIDGRVSNMVSGRMTTGDALSRLLAGSGLTFRYITAGSVVIEPAPRAADGAISLGPVRIEGDGGGSGAATLSATSDRGATEGTRSYTTRAARTSTKLTLSPRETPQSISVITRQQIEDRNFVTLDDALENTPGVTGNIAANFGQVNFSARGFSLGYQTDGVPAIGGTSGGYTPNLAIFDRVEVQRGAAGLVSGRGDPGGVVNLVRKRPSADRQLDVVLNGGSWNYVRGEVDATVPIAAGVRSRFIAAYEGRETFRKGESMKRPLLYGIVEADVTPQTLLTVGGSYEENVLNGFIPYGLPRYTNGTDLKLPRSSRGIAPNWTSGRFEALNLFGSVEHHFSTDWSIKAVGEWQRWKQIFVSVDTRGAVDPVTLAGPRYGALAGRYGEDPETLAFDAALTGEVNLFGRGHQIVVGGFHSNDVYEDATYQEVAVGQPRGNIFTFDPASVPAPAFPAAQTYTSKTTTRQTGIYGVSRFTLADPLKLILGARVSSVKNVDLDKATGDRSGNRESAVFTPYGGIILDVSRHWSVYASYAEIFQPQSTLFTAEGDRLPPITGANYEAGVKGAFYDGALNVSFAGFRIMQTNRSQIDPDNPAPCLGSPTGGDCYIADGKVRAQGFESEVSGELLPDWQLVASYAYTKTRYLRDRTASGTPSSNQGTKFNPTNPDHVVRLWSTYRLGDWTLGGGANYQSAVYRRDGVYRITQKGYALLNARLAYQVRTGLSVGVNVDNLTDKTYYARIGTRRNFSRYGDPRSVMATLRASF